MGSLRGGALHKWEVGEGSGGDGGSPNPPHLLFMRGSAPQTPHIARICEFVLFTRPCLVGCRVTRNTYFTWGSRNPEPRLINGLHSNIWSKHYFSEPGKILIWVPTEFHNHHTGTKARQAHYKISIIVFVVNQVTIRDLDNIRPFLCTAFRCASFWLSQ